MYYYKKRKTQQILNDCAFCGEPTKYELCKECYLLSKEEEIIKNENGKWIRNIVKGNEFKFYDEKKDYFLKEEILNKQELRFFNIIKNSLKKDYILIPQVNLQTIIETDTYTRNDELFRNIDFIIFHTEDFTPFLAIEINGQQHYTNEYWKERDKSVKKILEKAELPLLVLDVKDLKQLENNKITKIINDAIEFLEYFENKEIKSLTWLNENIQNLLKK